MKLPITETLVVIAPQGNPERRPRLEKTIRLAAARGWRVEYWGWARHADENCGADSPLVSRSRKLLSGGGYQGASVRVRYILWMLGVFVAVVRYRPHAVWALGLETALPVWVASWFVRLRYIFDDADRLVLLFKLPGPVKRMVRRLEQSVSAAACTHVIPGIGRYDYYSESMSVVANVPDRTQVEQAQRIHVERPDAALVLYANGWLTPTRGSSFIEAIATELEGDRRIQFLIACKTNGVEARSLTKLQNVRLLGSLDQVNALAWYKAADLVVTFYDPAVAINRFAEPNKWGDAAVMGSALLVNEEVETAHPWVQAGAAVTVPWNDVDAACHLIRRLAEDRSRVDMMIRATLNRGRDYSHFDVAVAPILDQLVRKTLPTTASA